MPKVFIFDMDGVIVNSELAWHELEYQHYSARIPGWTLADHVYLSGMSQKDSYPMLQERFGLKDSWEEHLAFYSWASKEVYRKRCELMHGVLELFRELKKRGIPLGLASSSPHNWINMVFEHFPIRDFFSCVVSSEDVGGRGKPSPEVYLEAAKRLEVEPGSCLAIEDSVNGMLSAKAAEMDCVGFRTGHNQDIRFPGALFEISDFGEANKKRLLRLFE